MEKKSKRVRIVGKGHATCYRRLLEEWYRQEIFTDVFLACDDNIECGDSPSGGDTCRRIPANKSVLAAASPTLAHIFSQSSPEDETQLVFTGYTYGTLRTVVEFIYTGSIQINKNERAQVEQLMEDLGLKLPFTTEVSSHSTSGSLFLEIDKNVESHEELMDDIQQTSSTEDAAVSAMPIDRPSSSNELEIIIPDLVHGNSLVWQKNQSKSQQVASNKPRKNWKKPVLKPPATRSGPLKRVNKLKLRTTHQILPDVPAPKEGLLESVDCIEPLNEGAQCLPHDSIDLEFVIAAPASDNREIRTERQQSVVIRMLNRKIDEDPSTDRHTRPDPLQKEYTCLGLSKSFSEKTIAVVGNALVPPVNIQHNGIQRRPTSTLHEAMRTSHFREIVNALSESPGLYTLYKERNYPVVETYYEPSISSMGSNLFLKSYLDKGVKRTYLEKSNACSRDQVVDLASCLMGKTIESLHEANGKVHIQIAGEPLVNKLSTPLFHDSPPSQLSTDEIATRMSFEHNYSTGESVQLTENPAEDTYRPEQSDDLNVFKRSVQLAINETRRNNRLRQKVQMLSKKVTLLKSKAMDLLVSCRDMRDKAGALSSQRAKKKANNHTSLPKSETKVPCGICNKIVKRSWLKRHLIIAHTSERNHLCDECGRTFALKGQLTSHQVRQHQTKPGNHVCDQCGRSFRFLRYLNRHMSLHSNVKPHVCRFCDKAFRLKTVLTKHIRTHTGERPYHCTICGRSFRQRTTYARHLKMHEKLQESGSVEMDGSTPGTLPRLKCEFCSMTFRLDLFRMLHRAKHTGETPCLPCPTCSMTFPSIKELSSHRKTEHPETVYACHLCPKIFTNKPNFDFHVLKHNDPQAIKKKYPLKPALDSGPCVCEFCDKVFKSRVSLDYHIKGIHLNGRTFRCEFCDKTLTSKAAYEQHKRTHDGELFYKCDLCPSAFREQLHLDAHIMSHTGEPMFVCPHCEKEFASQTSLYAHMRIHTGDRLECSFCQKILPSVDQLAIHEEACSVHIGEAGVA